LPEVFHMNTGGHIADQGDISNLGPFDQQGSSSDSVRSHNALRCKGPQTQTVFLAQ